MVYLVERFAHRGDHVGDGLLAQFELAAGGLLGLGESRAGQFEEGLAVAGEGVGGEGLEGIGELLPGVFEERHLLGGAPALGFEARLQIGGTRGAFAVPDEPRQREAGNKTQDRQNDLHWLLLSRAAGWWGEPCREPNRTGRRGRRPQRGPQDQGVAPPYFFFADNSSSTMIGSLPPLRSCVLKSVLSFCSAFTR